MKNNITQISDPFAQPYQSVSEAVAALTQPQRDRLLGIARRRFDKLTQSPVVEQMLAQSEPLEFVQDTIMLVLLGEVRPGQGRHTNVRHLASQHAFFNFLQGVLHSRISGYLKNQFYAAAQQEGKEESDSRTVVHDVVLNEIKTELSARLRAVAGNNAALQSTLSFLELESPETGPEPSRKQLCKMRRVSREVLRELAAGEDINQLFIN